MGRGDACVALMTANHDHPHHEAWLGLARRRCRKLRNPRLSEKIHGQRWPIEIDFGVIKRDFGVCSFPFRFGTEFT